MQNALNRRMFLKRATVTAGAISALPVAGPNILKAADAGKKLNCAIIGCGGRGMTHLGAIIGQNVVALVDPMESRFDIVKKTLKDKKQDPSSVQCFTDYRKMFEKVGKELDAVFIASPNHQHALPALIAMQMGKHVYCEKPVCHDIGEARLLREVARKQKVVTQMGNQGHCEDGYRKLCEYIWAGIIGPVKETHSWTDRANGGVGPRPPYEAVPKGMNWESWIGPAPYRDYHSDLHPHEWHGWHDFGNGSIGNMGCHVLDGTFWALKIDHPTSIEMEDVNGGSNERWPNGSRIRWDIPARGDMPAMKAYWYEGLKKGGQAEGNLRTAKGKARNIPPLLEELQKQYPEEEFGTNGTLYVGEKGIIYTGCYGERMRIIPSEKMQSTTPPPKTLPRPKGIFNDFMDAIRAGKTETAASFEYGTRLTEFTLLANLSQIAGVGKKIEWDGPNMKVTNIPELNAFVKRDNRDGWKA